MGKVSSKFISLLPLILLIIGWQLYSSYQVHLLFLLPSPLAILHCLGECRERLLFHSLITLKEMLGGLLLALTLSFPLAWGMYRWHSMRICLQPLFIIIQCIPMFTLAPLMVFWFGWSYVAIVIPTALMIFFPLTMNLYQGLLATPQELIEFFLINQATPRQIFLKLQLPWSVSHLIAGLRIATAIAGIGAVAGEWAGAQAGLGVLMLESRKGTDIELTFAALFCLFLISTGFYTMTLVLEKFFIRQPKNVIKKLKYGLAICLVPIFLLMGCKNNSTTKEKAETHLILDWLPNPNHIPLYTGIEKGFFRQRGIILKITKITEPGDTVSFLTSEKVDLAVYYMPETQLANLKGAPLLPIGFLIKEPLNAFIYRKENADHQLLTLDKKRLGYVVGGFGLTLLDNLLAINQIEPLEKLNVSFDLVSALATRRVEVIYGAYWNIESEHLRSLGIETDYISLQKLGHPTYYELIIVAKEGTPYANPQFIADFKLALQESIDYAIANPDEAFQIYVKSNLDKRPKTLAWERKAWLKTLPLLAKNQENELKVWQDFDNWLKGVEKFK